MLRVFMRNKKLATALALLVVVLMIAGCSGGPKTVAEVNGNKITRAQFDSYINSLRVIMPQLDQIIAGGGTALTELEEDILESMVANLLLKEAVGNHDIIVSAEEIDADYQDFRAQIIMMMMNGSETAYTDRLSELKISEDDVKELLSVNTYAEKLYEYFLPDVTDEEIRNFLADHPEIGKMPAMIEPSHILLGSEEDALAVRERVLAGEDFAELAKEVSTEPAAVQTGGYLDEIIVDDPYWDRTFMTAAAALEVGEISMPVQTQFGWHIITLHSSTEASELSFEEVRDTVADAVVSAKMSAYFRTLQEEADIKRML